VVHGLVGLKTHSKVALVVRREDGRRRRYVHVGTGNYNADTARIYSDLGLFTADDEIGADVSDLFNELTGSAKAPRRAFRRCLVSPHEMLPGLLARIDREAEHARARRPAHITIKVNGLSDSEVVSALYRASQAGVRIELAVRGLCTLRPGVPGLSHNIRVVSTLGRFLEHARIYRFGNAGNPEYFIGSADLRPRNLRRRVELLAPVSTPVCRERLDRLLELELDDASAWQLGADGAYTRREPEGIGSQEKLIHES
jgi:polyphosphate kinase